MVVCGSFPSFLSNLASIVRQIGIPLTLGRHPLTNYLSYSSFSPWFEVDMVIVVFDGKILVIFLLNIVTKITNNFFTKFFHSILKTMLSTWTGILFLNGCLANNSERWEISKDLLLTIYKIWSKMKLYRFKVHPLKDHALWHSQQIHVTWVLIAEATCNAVLIISNLWLKYLACFCLDPNNSYVIGEPTVEAKWKIV